jgi:hypothetical protein
VLISGTLQSFGLKLTSFLQGTAQWTIGQALWLDVFALSTTSHTLTSWFIALRSEMFALEYYTFLAKRDLFVYEMSSSTACLVLEYGGNRLGGLFIRFDDARKAILLGHPFVPRHLIQQGYIMRFFAAFLRAFPLARYYERGEVLIQPDVLPHVSAVISISNARPDNAILPVYKASRASNVAYSFPISNVL